MIKKNPAIIFLGLLVILMAACGNPFRAGTDPVEQASGASLMLSFSVSASRAIAPTAADVESAIFLYTVRMFSPGQADITATALAGQSVTIGNLKSGTVWSLYVQALDFANHVVAADFQEGVTILPAGQVTAVEVNLQPSLAAGYGDIMIGYNFPRSLGIDSAIVTLGFELATTIPVVVQQIPSSSLDRIEIVQNHVRVGRQLLTVEFKSKGTTIGYLHDLIWVFNGIVTFSPDGNVSNGYLSTDYFGKSPTAPRNLAMAAGDESIRLAWTPTSDVADSYVLERAKGDDGAWESLPEGLLGWQSTQYEDWNVVSGAKYRYRVQAVNRFGASAWAMGTAVTAPVSPVLLTTQYSGGDFDLNHYWPDGQPRALGGTFGSWAEGIAIEGGDVYVGGNDFVSLGGPPMPLPYYWKNGQGTALPTILSVDGSPEIVTGIAVRDGEVFVAGYVQDTDNFITNVLWKNGVRTDLDEGSAYYGYETGDVAVTYVDGPFGGRRVIVSGIARTEGGCYPVYWVDGKLVELKKQEGETGNYGSSEDSPRLALAGDRLVITATLDNQPLYWAGTLANLDPQPKMLRLGYATQAGVSDVAISDGNLYFSGYVSGKSYRRPVYWLNDSDPIPLALDDASYDAEATCIEVRGSKVYVGGFLVDRTGTEGSYPLFWRNGIPERLPVDVDGHTVKAMALPSGPEADFDGMSGQAGIYIDASQLLPRFAITGLQASYSPGGVAVFDLGSDALDGVTLAFDGAPIIEGWSMSGTEVTWNLPAEIDPGWYTLTAFGLLNDAALTASDSFSLGLALYGITGPYASGATCAFSTSVPGLDTANPFGILVRLAGSEVAASVDGSGVVSFEVPVLALGDYSLEVFVTINDIDYYAQTAVSVVGPT